MYTGLTCHAKNNNKLRIQLLEIIFFWYSKGSVIWRLLSNTFLYDLFLVVDNIDIAAIADNTRSYAIGNLIEQVIEQLEIISKLSPSGSVITK